MLSIIRKTDYNDWIIDSLFLTIGLLLLYFLWLGSYPLFTPDEGRYSEVAREMVVTGDYITPRVNGVAFLDKPVLYYWLQAISIHLFGIKEWSLRFFPALFGIGGCLSIYFFGRLLFDRQTGLLSALLLATSPVYFVGAHYANLDLEVAVLISLSLLSFLTGLLNKNHKTRFILAGWLFVSLAFLTKGLIALAFPAIIGGLWMLTLKRFAYLKEIHIFLGLLVFIAIVTPWYILVQRANPGFLHYFFVTQQFSRFLSKGEFNNQAVWWFYLPVILLGFFPWTVFLWQTISQSVRKVRQHKEAHPIELFLLIWAATVLIFFSIPHSKIITYLLPIFPAISLLTGRYLALAWNETSKHKMKRANLLFILFTILFALTMFYFSFPLIFPKLFKPYLYAISTLLITSSLMMLLFAKENKLKIQIIIGLACNGLLLSILTFGATHLNTHSTKRLVEHLNTIIHPEDEVITYHKYYQDLPLYLGRKVTIVSHWDAETIPKKDNWLREMWLGMRFQNTQAWLISEETFWNRFNSRNRVFVFLNASFLKQFKKQAKTYFYIGRQYDIILLSNQPTFLTAEMREHFLANIHAQWQIKG